MASYQYRLTGLFDWVSSVGNALVALENLASSGKRVTIRSLELDVQRIKQGSALERIFAGLVRGTGNGGQPITPAPLDTSVSLPSGIVVNSGGSMTINQHVGRSNLIGSCFDPNVSLISLVTPSSQGDSFRSNHTIGKKRGTPLTGAAVIRPGEAMGIVVSGYVSGAPSCIFSMTFSAGNSAFTATTFANPSAEGNAGIWIKNDSAGNVEVLDWSSSTLGSPTVSPYLQVVPYSGIPLETVDTARSFNLLSKTDSNDPSPASWVRVLKDTPLTPAGAPIQYASDIGAGVPKGFNYLGTKDFLGPVYRVFFPEGCKFTADQAAKPDGWGLDWPQKANDLMIRRGNGIVLRPGEGIAIAPAAESVSSAQTATSSMHPIYVNIVLDIENLIQPYLSLNNVQSGSDIVVLVPGTDTVIASVDSLGGTTYSLAYDPDEFTLVDVCIYKTGYTAYTVRNLDLGAFGATVPVSQTVDRNYSNP
jgi:hypothetical protein